MPSGAGDVGGGDEDIGVGRNWRRQVSSTLRFVDLTYPERIKSYIFGTACWAGLDQVLKQNFAGHKRTASIIVPSCWWWGGWYLVGQVNIQQRCRIMSRFVTEPAESLWLWQMDVLVGYRVLGQAVVLELVESHAITSGFSKIRSSKRASNNGIFGRSN